MELAKKIRANLTDIDLLVEIVLNKVIDGPDYDMIEFDRAEGLFMSYLHMAKDLLSLRASILNDQSVYMALIEDEVESKRIKDRDWEKIIAEAATPLKDEGYYAKRNKNITKKFKKLGG